MRVDAVSSGPSGGIPALDLFAGAGGLSVGLSRAGFEIAAAVEVDPAACETFASLHPQTELEAADVRGLRFRRLRDSVAVVVGGPPCQPFSSGGKRLAEDDPRDCLPDFVRSIEEVQPQAFLMENVPGLLRGRRRSYFLSVMSALAGLGFRISWKILHAADYGVPQRRQRLFVVGTRDEPFEFPKPTHGPEAGRPWVASGTVVSRERILGEPNPSIVTYAKNPDLRPSPYDGHLFNGGGRPIDLSAPAPTILASAGGNKTPFIDTLGIVPEYHAHLLRGGEPRSGKVEGARRITVQEAAAIQTFPPGTRFVGPRSTQYTLVGNAVPPKLAEVIGRKLCAHLSTDEQLPLAA